MLWYSFIFFKNGIVYSCFAFTGASGPSSGRATPSVQRPNYSRSHFDALSSIGGMFGF